MIGFSDEEFENRPKSVVVKDQTTIDRLEEQAEEFLNAILCRKGQTACICSNDRRKMHYSVPLDLNCCSYYTVGKKTFLIWYSIVAKGLILFFPYPSDVPNFSDPHIPVVAREILQRMIRQFAVEYTSKTSSPQDSPSDTQPHSDQSLSSPSLLPGAPSSKSVGTRPAHNQNPVLSKLLMADQDAPLDLTVKKPVAVPCSQGRWDLKAVLRMKPQYC